LKASNFWDFRFTPNYSDLYLKFKLVYVSISSPAEQLNPQQ